MSERDDAVAEIRAALEATLRENRVRDAQSLREAITRRLQTFEGSALTEPDYGVAFAVDGAVQRLAWETMPYPRRGSDVEVSPARPGVYFDVTLGTAANPMTFWSTAEPNAPAIYSVADAVRLFGRGSPLARAAASVFWLGDRRWAGPSPLAFGDDWRARRRARRARRRFERCVGADNAWHERKVAAAILGGADHPFGRYPETLRDVLRHRVAEATASPDWAQPLPLPGGDPDAVARGVAATNARNALPRLALRRPRRKR